MLSTRKVEEALAVLRAVGLPTRQINERSALVLLALLDLKPDTDWSAASAPFLGITPAMDWMRAAYGKRYAPNTRETIRRETMHQFVSAGLAVSNPDDANRPVNSPKTVYRVEPRFLALARSFGTRSWDRDLDAFLQRQRTLSARYARERTQRRVPVQLREGQELTLSGGSHSSLIREIIEDFGPRFVPGGRLVYVGDTGSRSAYFDEELLASIGISLNAQGKMPDVILFDVGRNWLFLVEAVTSHGPMNGKRYDELSKTFGQSSAGLVFTTAFPTRSVMARHVGDIAWETEVWVAESPSHLIHFDGDRFLGPHAP